MAGARNLNEGVRLRRTPVGCANRRLQIISCKVRPSRTMARMRKIEKPSPTESPLLFAFDPKPAEEMLTALGGLPLVVQALSFSGITRQCEATSDCEGAPTGL
jgi:hypothetical protein